MNCKPTVVFDLVLHWYCLYSAFNMKTLTFLLLALYLSVGSSWVGSLFFYQVPLICTIFLLNPAN